MATDVVTAFLREGAEILLLRRSDDAPTHAGRWGGVSGYAEGDPDGQVRREIAEETALEDAVELVRAGRPLEVEDGATTWRVHPYLFDCADRSVALSDEHEAFVWTSPTEIVTGELDAVPALWAAYERVAPTVQSVAADADHGASYLSLRALEVLRDRAALVGAEPGTPSDEWTELAELARRLVTVRPAMAVLRNRVNRAMATADEQSAGGVLERTSAGLERALAVDESVAAAAATRAQGRVLTLSWSGTVLEALRDGQPDRVFVAESRPACEGVDVAETLAGEQRVTLHTDAAAATILAREDVDRVIVGADTVLSTGAVVNKTGTRGVAIAAAHEGVPVTVVAATDKVTPRSSPNLEHGDRESVYGGDVAIDVANPTFDVTPPAVIDEIVTEEGPVVPASVQSMAADLEALETW